MRPNSLKALWRDGKPAINAWLAVASSFSAEVMAHAGFDTVTVDTQHGMVDGQEAIAMLQAISTTPAVPLMRVVWNDPALIMKALDSGAYGVICPMINTAAECQAFVGACRYAPDGYRSVGPARGTLYGGSDYLLHANEEIVTLAMIETRQAMDNLDAILDTPGLDGVYIGPNDLSLSLGYAASPDPQDEEVQAAIARVLQATKARGQACTMHATGGAMGRRLIDQGMDLVTVAVDSRMIALGAAAEIKAARGN
jgi:4-hydroxy-2-oxoheptanedioate aldolase